jgi:hypothetical protein
MSVSLIKSYDKTWERVIDIRTGRVIGFMSPNYRVARVSLIKPVSLIKAYLCAHCVSTLNTPPTRHERHCPRNWLYCKHGTYTGHPYGPDYMCGYCESE